MPTNPGTDNLVSWWSLDEASGTRNDSHGSNHLTDNNTVGSTTGKQSNAADFERDNSEYLNIPNNSSLQLAGNGAFSITLWAKPESYPSIGRLLFKGDGGTPATSDYGISIVSATAFRFTCSSAATFHDLTVSGGPGLGSWVFIAAVYDSGAQTMEVSLNNGTPTQRTSVIPVASTKPLNLGRIDGAGQHFDGLIDEASLFNKALTADEIDWLYNSGSGRAYSDLSAAAGLAQPLSGPFGRKLAGLVR